MKYDVLKIRLSTINENLKATFHSGRIQVLVDLNEIIRFSYILQSLQKSTDCS